MITTINNKNYRVDLPNNRITFLDSRWYYTPEGQPVPSVTTILDAFPKTAQYYEWLKKMGEDADGIRDDAGRRGSRVHSLTEDYDNGREVSLFTEDGDLNLSLMEWNMFERYVDFSARFPHTNEVIEAQLVSANLGYAGTMDRIIELDGRRILVDIKTSNAIYESYWLQLAAYDKLLEELKNQVDDVAILWLNAKTRTEGKKGAIQGKGWSFIVRDPQERPKDYKLFQHTHALWLSQNEALAPKQTSYQLKYIKDGALV